jgi:hypothetical protein
MYLSVGEGKVSRVALDDKNRKRSRGTGEGHLRLRLEMRDRRL